MFSRRFVGLMISLCAALQANHARAATPPVIYGCEVTAKNRLALAKNPLLIMFDPANKVVLAMDPLIHSVTGGSGVTAQVVRDTPKDLVLRWTLKGVRDNRSARSDLRYEARIGRKDGSLRLTIVPEAYPGSYSYRGHCEVVRDKPGKRPKK
ncbi:MULTISPECIES: hypothetical protein [Gemmobacter]|nr:MULTISPECIES: hypothetical protein [Gemmobacter]